MRPIGLGLAAALLMAVFTPLAAAHAAPKASAGAVTKDQRDKGMAAAPGLISAAGLDCQVADARLIGEGQDAKTKAKTTLYELACAGNEGVIVQKTGDATPQAYTCLQFAEPGPDGKPNPTQCVLPGNSDPKAGLIPYIAKAGRVCTPDKARALGQSSTNAVFEVACKEGGGGYVLATSAPPRLDKPASMDPCVGFPPGGTITCTLTDRAHQLAVVDQLLAKSGKPCTVKDRAYIGATKDGVQIYEVACQEGKGFMLEQAGNGDLKAAIDCAAADAIGGGCKLTDARQAKTEQSGLYTTLAKKAGFDCQVSGYAPLPANLQGKEVVELACANRPDGAIAIFSAKAGDASVIYDCARSELAGYRCGLSKPAAAYGKLTADLKTLGKTSCQVANARAVGVTADQRGYMEVACADGLPGYMIEYAMTPLTPKTALVCADARGISGGCSLAGNVKK